MKSIKVFQNGERLRDIYPHATSFQVFKWKVRKAIRLTLRTLFVMSVIALIVGVAYSAGEATHFEAQTVHAQSTTPNPLPDHIASLKLSVVKEIEACESKGLSQDDGAIILDTNNKMSIGQLMFQKRTVIYYEKDLYNNVITPKDAVLLALDTARAETLAEDIIFSTPNGLSNWYNCSKAHNLQAKVDIINQLIKTI